MFCKTIILSNSSNLSSNAPKGILTLSKQNNFVKGKIRLYNLASLPTSSKLGLYVNQQVYTAQILKKANYYEFDLNENVDITPLLFNSFLTWKVSTQTQTNKYASFSRYDRLHFRSIHTDNLSHPITSDTLRWPCTRNLSFRLQSNKEPASWQTE